MTCCPRLGSARRCSGSSGPTAAPCRRRPRAVLLGTPAMPRRASPAARQRAMQVPSGRGQRQSAGPLRRSLRLQATSGKMWGSSVWMRYPLMSIQHLGMKNDNDFGPAGNRGRGCPLAQPCPSRYTLRSHGNGCKVKIVPDGIGQSSNLSGRRPACRAGRLRMRPAGAALRAPAPHARPARHQAPPPTRLRTRPPQQRPCDTCGGCSACVHCNSKAVKVSLPTASSARFAPDQLARSGFGGDDGADQLQRRQRKLGLCTPVWCAPPQDHDHRCHQAVVQGQHDWQGRRPLRWGRCCFGRYSARLSCSSHCCSTRTTTSRSWRVHDCGAAGGRFCPCAAAFRHCLRRL